MGDREPPKKIKDPEDIRIGTTLDTIMDLTGWNHDKLATAIGVTRPYITQFVSGQKHLNNVRLVQICGALNINPLAIKRPDLKPVDTACTSI